MLRFNKPAGTIATGDELKMGFRFRTSVKLLPGVRLNLSAGKRGFTTGISAGVKGARFSVNSRGEQRTTYSLPGTGISHVTMNRLGSAAGSDHEQPSSLMSQGARPTRSVGVLLALGILLFPYVFAWLLLRPGYSALSRIVAFGWMALLVWLFAAGSSAPPAPSPQPQSLASLAPTIGFVSASSLRCRAEPQPDGRQVASLMRGARLSVDQVRGDWSLIRKDGGNSCWVLSRYLSGAAPQAAPSASMSRRASTSLPAPRRSTKRAGGGSSCPCSGSRICVGPRGGRYCITSGGNKRYGV